MRFKGNNQGCFSLFISSLATAIFINYLVVGFIDYVHSINDLLQWLNQSGILPAIKQFLGVR
jgi:hypothetical protein